METTSALPVQCVGKSSVAVPHDDVNIFRVTSHLCGEFTGPGEFRAQRPVTRSLMFSLIYARINGSINNREAGDLRRHRAHYDVILMPTKAIDAVLGYFRDVNLNKLLNKQTSCQWFDTPWSPYDVTVMLWYTMK